jgi:hypothetical protein
MPAGQYGPRLTDEEYDRRIVELHRGMSPMPTPEEDRAIRHRALDLAIDHRFGRDFPQARRDALWAASERVEAQRLRLGLKYLLSVLVRSLRRTHATALTNALAAEYSKVLTQPELEQFLGLDKGQRPELPVDR